MFNIDEYPFEIRALNHNEGSGFLISFPDISMCISNGNTIDEAIANGRVCLAGMIQALHAWEQPVPAPHSGGYTSGKLASRLPKN